MEHETEYWVSSVGLCAAIIMFVIALARLDDFNVVFWAVMLVATTWALTDSYWEMKTED